MIIDKIQLQLPISFYFAYFFDSSFVVNSKNSSQNDESNLNASIHNFPLCVQVGVAVGWAR